MNNIKTIDPEMVSVNLFFKKDFYKSASNYLDYIGNLPKELDVHLEWLKTDYANDPIKAKTDFFKNLDLKSLKTDFVVHWLKQYKTTYSEVQDQVRLEMGPNATINRNPSDCVGSLARMSNYTNSSTQLVSDRDMENLPVPALYGAGMENTLSNNAKIVNSSFSKSSNSLFRYSSFNLQEKVSENTLSHGQNMIPDYNHYQRMMKSINDVTQKLRQEFSDFFRVNEFYSNYNPNSQSTNVQVVPPTIVTTLVEGQVQYQTQLKSRAADILTSFTNRRALDTVPIS
jgi:hypothetical protein